MRIFKISFMLSFLFAFSALASEARIKPGAVVYGVVPPMYGYSPLKSVTEHMDNFKELGVDVLWLLPIHASDDEGLISYAITDYLKVREDFGNESDLRQLVREAHLRDIKVILDFVPNHTSVAHPYFMDAENKGSESPYYSFFERDADGNPLYFFDWEHLVNLNYKNKSVVKMMTDAFLYWIKKTSVDGYRVDVAWGVRKRAPEFWGPLIKTLRQERSQTFMLAEASARDPYYFQKGFDAAYDWTKRLGEWSWKNFFRKPQKAGELLSKVLASDPHPERILRFLNNNDTGIRFISRYGAELTKVAVILQHTIPGIPLLFTGDEIGAEYSPYDDPPPIQWKDPHKLRPLYKKLAQLREDRPALHSGDFRVFDLPKSASVLAFTRTSGSDRLLVLINFDKKTKVNVRLLSGPTRFKDLLSGRTMKAKSKVDGGYIFDLPRRTAYVFHY